jgi:hypothetical protein
VLEYSARTDAHLPTLAHTQDFSVAPPHTCPPFNGMNVYVLCGLSCGWAVRLWELGGHCCLTSQLSLIISECSSLFFGLAKMAYIPGACQTLLWGDVDSGVRAADLPGGALTWALPWARMHAGNCWPSRSATTSSRPPPPSTFGGGQRDCRGVPAIFKEGWAYAKRCDR